MLKTLEETPDYASIILLTKTQESLLPTVISRCQKVPVENSDHKDATERAGESSKKIEIRKIIQMSVERKFDWAQELAKEEREDVLEMLEEWVGQERANLSEDLKKAQNIRLILEIKDDLERTNLNCRLALETLVLNLS
jgi:DNA polymerase-3 subunit delta'